MDFAPDADIREIEEQIQMWVRNKSRARMMILQHRRYIRQMDLAMKAGNDILVQMKALRPKLGVV